MRPWPPLRISRTFTVLVVATVTISCASRGAIPRPFPTPRSSQGSAGTPGSAGLLDAGGLVGTALSFRGVPYRNGGASPSGFDCSGFTQYVFSHHGVELPRDVRDQFQHGQSVRVDDVAPGDLLFFTTTGPGPTHVGIAVGGGQFVHAPSSTGVVRVERLSAGYWSTRYLGARRLTRP